MEPIVADYLQPIEPNSPAGEPPQYLTEFETIRNELDKVAGCNFELIEASAKQILLEHAKDLRVSGYLLLAMVYNAGIDGLIEGLNIYRSLLETFGDALHPLRPKARAAAIAWLNQARFVHFSKGASPLTMEQYQQLSQNLQALNQAIHQHLGDEFGQFSALNVWLKEQRPTEEEAIALQPEKTSFATKMLQKIKPSAVSQEHSSSPVLSIENEKQFSESGKLLVDYSRSEQWYYAQILIARAMKWQHLVLPGHTDNKTLLPEPRKSGITEVESAYQAGEYSLLLKRSEVLFMESGGHFLLDLQFYSCHALEKLGELGCLKILQTLTCELIRKIPELPELTYQSGVAFANSETRHWLDALLNSTDKMQDAAPIDAEKNHQYFIQQAKSYAASKQLSDQLKALAQLPTGNAKEVVEKQFAEAQLLSLKHKDLAGFRYQQILEDMQATQMARWFPELACQILQAYRLLLKDQKLKQDELQKVVGWLCRIDPLAALS